MNLQAEKIREVANRLETKPEWLDALINFETGGTYSTVIKNPYSSARGLIQFTDRTARNLGYADSLALVNANYDFNRQMEVVYRYLQPYAPFGNQQQLYMAVFYPEYMNASPFKQFPKVVQDANPGIKNPRDYIRFVNRRVKEDSLHFPKRLAVPLIAVTAGAVTLFLILRKRL